MIGKRINIFVPEKVNGKMVTDGEIMQFEDFCKMQNDGYGCGIGAGIIALLRDRNDLRTEMGQIDPDKWSRVFQKESMDLELANAKQEKRARERGGE